MHTAPPKPIPALGVLFFYFKMFLTRNGHQAMNIRFAWGVANHDELNRSNPDSFRVLR